MLNDILFFVIGLIVGWFFLPSPLWASSMMAGLSQKWPWLKPYTTTGTTTGSSTVDGGSVTPVPGSSVTGTTPTTPTTRTPL